MKIKKLSETIVFDQKNPDPPFIKGNTNASMEEWKEYERNKRTKLENEIKKHLKKAIDKNIHAKYDYDKETGVKEKNIIFNKEELMNDIIDIMRNYISWIKINQLWDK